MNISSYSIACTCIFLTRPFTSQFFILIKSNIILCIIFVSYKKFHLEFFSKNHFFVSLSFSIAFIFHFIDFSSYFIFLLGMKELSLLHRNNNQQMTITQIPQFTLGFTLGFVHSVNLDKCIMTYIYCHSVTQNIFN